MAFLFLKDAGTIECVAMPVLSICTHTLKVTNSLNLKVDARGNFSDVLGALIVFRECYQAPSASLRIFVCGGCTTRGICPRRPGKSTRDIFLSNYGFQFAGLIPSRAASKLATVEYHDVVLFYLRH
jgi:hypothetical protein